MQQTSWAVAVLVAAIAFGASSWIVPDFGGFEADQFPVPQNDPPVQPAGYAFAIWALIYVWLLISAGFGLISRREAPDWAEMRPALVLSLAVGATWLPVANVSPLAAAVLIWVMLLAALAALFRAPLLDRWYARAPLGVYAGWLSAASFVALGLVFAGYGLMGEVRAAILFLILAIIMAGTIQVLLEGVPEYGITVVWALVAVALANIGGPGLVFVLAVTGSIIMGLLALRAWSLPRA
ncbi:hypothetical protein [Thalassococcus sp. S3]|uniref:hypothetical protein n=1 Tax=Thalassococcus sp. S3 TaxID=2017482 RepID=UPI001024510E|nr:hypothetical protein [Thalassococcus sp. S3]QBF33254.1 hypothetical protein CFI11_18785 [Thalassococcus sp. S3]